jgi:hypothetical protein
VPGVFKTCFVNSLHPTSFPIYPTLRVEADYAVLAELSRGLSGGDILNVCVNAIHAGSTDVDSANWRWTQEMIEAEIAKAKKAKAEHAGEKTGPMRRIGVSIAD